MWMNMAILPCAVASVSDHTCPHCPPAEQAEMAAHHWQHKAGTEPTCASMQSQCYDLDEVSVDARSGKLKVEDVFDDTFAPVVTPLAVSAVADQAIVDDAYPPDPGGSSTPLYILYCVYLD
jgi:hypothetical protein